MANQISETENPREFTARHMAMIMAAFFGVIFAVNGYMAFVAISSWTGSLARNGYVASQDFNARLAERRRQDSLGFQSVLRYGDQVMVFSLRDRSGLPLEGFDVSLQVGRPSNESEDRKIELKEHKPGIYRQNLVLAPGQWNAEVIAVDNAGRRHRRLVRLYVNG